MTTAAASTRSSPDAATSHHHARTGSPVGGAGAAAGASSVMLTAASVVASGGRLAPPSWREDPTIAHRGAVSPGLPARGTMLLVPSGHTDQDQRPTEGPIPPRSGPRTLLLPPDVRRPKAFGSPRLTSAATPPSSSANPKVRARCAQGGRAIIRGVVPP